MASWIEHFFLTASSLYSCDRALLLRFLLGQFHCLWVIYGVDLFHKRRTPIDTLCWMNPARPMITVQWILLNHNLPGSNNDHYHSARYCPLLACFFTNELLGLLFCIQLRTWFVDLTSCSDIEGKILHTKYGVCCTPGCPLLWWIAMIWVGLMVYT